MSFKMYFIFVDVYIKSEKVLVFVHYWKNNGPRQGRVSIIFQEYTD